VSCVTVCSWRARARATQPRCAAWGGQGACSVADTEPIFQPWPPEIHFRGYAPFESCTAQLFLRNNDEVRRASLLQQFK